MITNEQQEKVQGWFTGRLPKEWTTAPAEVTVDREEITVILTIDDVEAGESEVEQAEAGRGEPVRSARRPATPGSRSPVRPSTATSARCRGG